MTARPGADPSSWRFEAIGTAWEVRAAGLGDRMRGEVAALIDRFDAEWSRFREDSLVRRLARGESDDRSTGWPARAKAPSDTVALLDTYATLSEATAGGVNPLAGTSLESLGYDAVYSLRGGDPVPAPERWRELLHWSAERIELREPAVIDVGGIGKGRLVDLVAGRLAGRLAGGGGIVVDAGGDLVATGEPVRVALEHPYDPRRAVGVVEVADEALCASASNRRAWGDGLHHVIDARTGRPVETVVACWALAADAMRADAVATALFFEEGPALAASWGVHWVRMLSDGRLQWALGSRRARGAAELFV